MATLTETTRVVRKFGLGFIVLMTAYTLLTVGSGVFKSFWAARNPPPPPGPAVKFGKLPPLHLSGILPPQDPQPNYILETITGSLPNFPPMVEVYPLITPKPNPLEEDRALGLAANLGFRKKPQRLSNVDYLWEDENGSTLRMDIITKNFKIRGDREKITFIPGMLPPAEKITEGAKNFLSSKAPLGKTFTLSSQKITFLHFDGKVFEEVLNPAAAEAARVDFFRYLKVDGGKIPLLGQNPKMGITRLLIAGGVKITYLDVDFTEWVFDLENGTTYPLKKAQSAWEELKSGRGKIVYLGTSNGVGKLKAVTIREVFLAYFDDEQRQNFLQPIYVFSGEAEILGGGKTDYITYVPAVDPTWVIE